MSVYRSAWLAGALGLSLVACHPSSSSAAAPPPDPAASGPAAAPANAIPPLRKVPLTITGHGKTSRFTVEVAASEAEQEQGLMYRQSLAPDAGMIFPFPTERVATFWMKNTYIPLDMVFIRKNGTIARIGANAVPMTLDVVSSNEPVTAVLEIAGGRAAELGLQPGDVVHWKQ
jgi:uncharacterized membrane protein (UPF0127 family)